MQLRQNQLNQLNGAQNRFLKLRDQFKTFVGQLEFFGNPRCPVQGVSVSGLADDLSFLVQFATIQLSMRLHLEVGDQGVAKGKVLVHLHKPWLNNDTPVLLGSFTFNGQGVTDIQDASGQDPAEMDTHAPEIVAHFLGLALQQSPA
jgi:hypothetical protein